jgi:thioredoxin-dependent peroxiredoxin
MKLAINSKAPDFSAEDQNGVTHSLGDYSGKWLLLYFYPKDFTTGCTIEARQMRDHFPELKSRVEIVGVSADSVDSHAKFAEEFKLPFTLLADPDKKMLKAYGTDGFLFGKRTSFLIDPRGMIVKIYEKVKPETHVKEILQDFDRLEKG